MGFIFPLYPSFRIVGLTHQPTEDLMVTKAVLVPYPIDKAYDYAVPSGMDVRDGDYVVVPLGSRNVIGVVWGDGAQGVPSTKIKTILQKYDVPPMNGATRKFLAWGAHYTMTDLGSFLKLTLSVPSALEPPKSVKAYVGVGAGDGLSPKHKAVMEVAKDGLPRRASEIAREAGVGAGVIKTLHEKGYLKELMVGEPAPCIKPDFTRKGADLTQTQRQFSNQLVDAIKEQHTSFLLDGVTGSGKTEVYFEGVAECLRQGKQALIMLPEIALSNAFLQRFKDRFGCAPALWHSSLSDGLRKTTWRGVANGDCKVVVGARSSLFLPYKNLGLIVVDEEHDPAYKQEEGVIYNARDMAVVRAHMEKIPVVMVSATPSLETMQNAWNNKYGLMELPDRYGGAGMPDVHVIDLTKDKPERNHFIAPSLVKEIQKTIEGQRGQALLFLNRRGYAPLTLCRTCGHRFECPRCSAWLIEHKKTGKLHCHHCGYDCRVPPACPKCNDKDSLAACGPGVERVLEEVKELFPDARTCVLSSDTATTHDELKTMLDDIKNHKVDIIIGTQIIAKGHHFPKLTLVGVIDADLGLSGGDLRASERTFQLLHQVAGRAGREEEKGHVYLQSFNPDTRVMKALSSGNRDNFLSVEAMQREAAKMPPFTRLAGIIVSGRDEGQVIEISKKLGQTAPHAQGIQTLGPADAPMYKLRGKFRRRLLVRADKAIDIQKSISHWLHDFKIPSTVRVQVDIDPQSFF